MIKSVQVTSFKSLSDVTVELGQINVFIGANGSGKSNFLEAIGVLSAAASGRIDDASLMTRGVRPGLPALYKTAFTKVDAKERIPLTIDLEAHGQGSSGYKTNLYNPINDPAPAWRYHAEIFTDEAGHRIVGRSNASKDPFNSEAGLAALKLVDMVEDTEARRLLVDLQGYRVYSPNTPTLRGISQETQPQRPVGLSGGGLPGAVNALLRLSKDQELIQEAFESVYEMIDWATRVDAVPSSSISLSPSAATSKDVVRFVDRFMVKERSTLSGADASEGALYVLYTMALLLDPNAPAFLAIDNADHGLNPRLAKRLMELVCEWILHGKLRKQVLLTTHNPLVLDGLPLLDDRVRLFTVARLVNGRTNIQRVVIDEKLRKSLEIHHSLSRLWVMGHIGGVPNV